MNQHETRAPEPGRPKLTDPTPPLGWFELTPAGQAALIVRTETGWRITADLPEAQKERLCTWAVATEDDIAG